MASPRRKAKLASLIKHLSSSAILYKLNDPRIEDAIISVTEVELSNDLRVADIYLSIMAENDSIVNRTFAAVCHAQKYIQGLVGQQLDIRFMPELRFHKDEKMKKTLETLRLIEQVSREFKSKADAESADAEGLGIDNDTNNTHADDQNESMQG